MSLIRCGTDETGSYIELRKPKGETPLCFIDAQGVEHETIRLYQYRVVRTNQVVDNLCVMCGELIPEGSMVCNRCREVVESYG